MEAARGSKSRSKGSEEMLNSSAQGSASCSLSFSFLISTTHTGVVRQRDAHWLGPRGIASSSCLS